MSTGNLTGVFTEREVETRVFCAPDSTRLFGLLRRVSLYAIRLADLRHGFIEKRLALGRAVGMNAVFSS